MRGRSKYTDSKKQQQRFVALLEREAFVESGYEEGDHCMYWFPNKVDVTSLSLPSHVCQQEFKQKPCDMLMVSVDSGVHEREAVYIHDTCTGYTGTLMYSTHQPL